MSLQNVSQDNPVFETPDEGLVKCNLNPLTCVKRIPRSSVRHGQNFVCTHEKVPPITDEAKKELLVTRSCVTRERS